jgi:hypothetical protein
MHFGPPIPSQVEEAERHFEELTAEQLKAKLLFRCYLEDEEPQGAVDDDAYYSYYAEDAAL